MRKLLSISKRPEPAKLTLTSRQLKVLGDGFFKCLEKGRVDDEIKVKDDFLEAVIALLRDYGKSVAEVYHQGVERNAKEIQTKLILHDRYFRPRKPDRTFETRNLLQFCIDEFDNHPRLGRSELQESRLNIYGGLILMNPELLTELPRDHWARQHFAASMHFYNMRLPQDNHPLFILQPEPGAERAFDDPKYQHVLQEQQELESQCERKEKEQEQTILEDLQPEYGGAYELEGDIRLSYYRAGKPDIDIKTELEHYTDPRQESVDYFMFALAFEGPRGVTNRINKWGRNPVTQAVHDQDWPKLDMFRRAFPKALLIKDNNGDTPLNLALKNLNEKVWPDDEVTQETYDAIAEMAMNDNALLIEEDKRLLRPIDELFRSPVACFETVWEKVQGTPTEQLMYDNCAKQSAFKRQTPFMKALVRPEAHETASAILDKIPARYLNLFAISSGAVSSENVFTILLQQTPFNETLFRKVLNKALELNRSQTLETLYTENDDHQTAVSIATQRRLSSLVEHMQSLGPAPRERKITLALPDFRTEFTDGTIEQAFEQAKAYLNDKSGGMPPLHIDRLLQWISERSEIPKENLIYDPVTFLRENLGAVPTLAALDSTSAQIQRSGNLSRQVLQGTILTSMIGMARRSSYLGVIGLAGASVSAYFRLSQFMQIQDHRAHWKALATSLALSVLIEHPESRETITRSGDYTKLIIGKCFLDPLTLFEIEVPERPHEHPHAFQEPTPKAYLKQLLGRSRTRYQIQNAQNKEQTRLQDDQGVQERVQSITQSYKAQVTTHPKLKTSREVQETTYKNRKMFLGLDHDTAFESHPLLVMAGVMGQEKLLEITDDRGRNIITRSIERRESEKTRQLFYAFPDAFTHRDKRGDTPLTVMAQQLNSDQEKGEPVDQALVSCMTYVIWNRPDLLTLTDRKRNMPVMLDIVKNNAALRAICECFERAGHRPNESYNERLRGLIVALAARSPKKSQSALMKALEYNNVEGMMMLLKLSIESGIIWPLQLTHINSHEKGKNNIFTKAFLNMQSSDFLMFMKQVARIVFMIKDPQLHHDIAEVLVTKNTSKRSVLSLLYVASQDTERTPEERTQLQNALLQAMKLMRSYPHKIERLPLFMREKMSLIFDVIDYYNFTEMERLLSEVFTHPQKKNHSDISGLKRCLKMFHSPTFLSLDDEFRRPCQEALDDIYKHLESGKKELEKEVETCNEAKIQRILQTEIIPRFNSIIPQIRLKLRALEHHLETNRGDIPFQDLGLS